jgi:antitoxin component YwqK of YwqJK toxin-antitoxin module
MNRSILLLPAFLLLCTTSFGQSPKEKMLFVIDSIPILTDPEEWNHVLQEDIADIRVLRSKDSLALFGYKNLDGITYIFTKEYRNRPDSLKKIPSLKQMVRNGNVWTLHNTVYTGKYIDYFNSGKIQDEGTLLDGKIDGEVIVYFKNGNKKSEVNYKNGFLDGIWNDYYTNGVLMQTREFSEWKQKRAGKIYFITGQIQNEVKPKKNTHYDTAFTYYSTGKVKRMKLIRDGALVLHKNDEVINYYTPRFYQSLNTGDIKEANKSFYEIWKADSTSADTYFKNGLLLLKELRFDMAIDEFDKALQIEPLMREALVHRGLARIKRHQFSNVTGFSKEGNKALTLEDINSLPDDEQDKICSDLQQAEYVDFSDVYVKKIIPGVILDYCRKKNSDRSK